MHFSGDLVLRTHMRMNGSWHIYRPGEPWQQPRRDMRVVVATADFEAVGFNIPVAEFLTARELQRHDELRALGPDLLGERFDAADAFARARERPTMEIADALLNQRVIAGSATSTSRKCCSCAASIRSRWSHTSATRISACLIDTAHRFLLANVSTGLAPMTTYTGYRRTTRRDDPVGAALGLRPRAAAVPPLRHADPGQGTGTRRAAHVLVPEVSGGEG